MLLNPRRGFCNQEFYHYAGRNEALVRIKVAEPSFWVLQLWGNAIVEEKRWTEIAEPSFKNPIEKHKVAI